MDFKYEKDRIYAKDGDGKLLAEICFPKISQDMVCIDHTYTHSSLRGQGVADSLMQAAVAEISERGLKATATCSYARRWLSEHPEHNNMEASKSRK